MRTAPIVALLLLCASGLASCGSAGCGASEAPRSSGTEPPSTAPVTDTSTVPGTDTSAVPPANPRTFAAQVPTEPLDATPIRITVDDLPAPGATDSARNPPRVIDPPADARLQVPPGFVVQRFAEGIDSPRWLARTPDGDVLVAQSREDRITRLRDTDGDGVADDVAPFADETNGIDLPFGMAFAGAHFYVGSQSEVRRFPWRPGQLRLEGTGERIAPLPGGGYNQHWTRNVVLAPDGQRLFVSVGSASNASPEPPPRASVLVMDLDGGNRRVFASGLRNPVGLAFHPATGELHATVNERDHLGDDLVPDYFTRVEDGAFYGWPYAYLAPHLLDPGLTRNGRSRQPDLAARTRTPDVLFRAHSAALGLAFYDGTAFPPRYRHGAFVAHRGSWNRSEGVGYQIVFIPFESGRPVGYYEPFVAGFLVDPSVPATWGRPVGVLTLPDGSLLFTDETGGRIYRVQYAPT